MESLFLCLFHGMYGSVSSIKDERKKAGGIWCYRSMYQTLKMIVRMNKYSRFTTLSQFIDPLAFLKDVRYSAILTPENVLSHFSNKLRFQQRKSIIFYNTKPSDIFYQIVIIDHLDPSRYLIFKLERVSTYIFQTFHHHLDIILFQVSERKSEKIIIILAIDTNILNASYICRFFQNVSTNKSSQIS